MGAPVTLARRPVVPTLGAVLEAHPTLRVALVMADRPIAWMAEPSDAALVARQLTPGARFVVASPASRAQRHPAYASGAAGARRDHLMTKARAARHGVLLTRSEGDG